jgi:DNA (cytosine-5)-methyltransferase 1
MQTYKAVDLFSGAGGLSLGFMQTGRIQIVAAAENNPNARKTYKRNLKVPRLYSDVRTVDYSELLESVGPIDIVIGGPPCQGFSNANRQHTTIISMNNRLVKEYVRAICELRPKAFVMENVAMLRSQIHRFMVDEKDLTDNRVMGLELNNDEVEILPASSALNGALEFVKQIKSNSEFAWSESFYKTMNLLYRYRINQDKFNKSLDKYIKLLTAKLNEVCNLYVGTEDVSLIHKADKIMAESLLAYIENRNNDFANLIKAIETPLFMQRAILKVKELTKNDVHVFEYKESSGSVVAMVKSYAVLDYIKCVLETEPFSYVLTTQVLNAIHYGAAQKRERFIIVGTEKNTTKAYVAPKPTFTDKFRTVCDAIADLQEVPADTDKDAKPISLAQPLQISDLGRELRGRLLYNHITTTSTDTALARFKALKAGQNFHDLDPTLKTTYSNANRTQNTIYMRLKYDEPSGTVVNVRKSMWIHPELDRAISIREAARLQTFPDSFVFEGTKDSQYQQVGNAVPPFLAKAIANSIIAVLDDDIK